MKRLVLDIETIPLRAGESDENEKKAALDALSGRIVCIGGILVDEFRALSAFTLLNDDESALLLEFWDRLEREQVKCFIAHNGLSFDLPFIWRRSVVNQVRPRFQFDLRRYKTEPIYDTMCVWGNWEPRGNVSLDALAKGLGLGSKSGSGAEVSGLWNSGRFEELADYCLHDCWLTYGCYCKMNFRTPSHFSQIERGRLRDTGTRQGHTPAIGLEDHPESGGIGSPALL
ncbi:MAG TPA: hypothetical protein VK578_21455 [Edaphobacter sp.]|nr:hypothetical protein [Edaphobacter sp.]